MKYNQISKSIVRQIKYIIGVFLFSLVLYNCNQSHPIAKTNNRNYAPLLALIANYQISNNLKLNSGTGVSIVDIKHSDIMNYEGTCIDTFTAFDGAITISADSYWQTIGGPLFPNSPLERKAISTSSCSSLGFTGGFKQTDSNQTFSFKTYVCNPSQAVCTSTAITAAGYTGQNAY